MKKYLFVLATVGMTTYLVPALFAQEGPPAASTAAPTNVAEEVEIRDPFWPVGYKKQKSSDIKKEKIKVEEDKRKQIKWPQLDVKGVTSTRKGFIAIVQGHGIVSPGRVIKVTSGGLIYRWKIEDITDAGLSLRKLDVTPVGHGQKPIMIYSKD